MGTASFNDDNLIVSSEGIISEGGVVAIKETTTPTDVAGYGRIYTKNDNKLYFQDGAATEAEVQTTETHSHYGEMYIYNNGVAATIDEVNTWHGAVGFSTGDMDSHLTFVSSITQAITAWADAGGTPNEVTATSAGCQAAGLTAGQYVTITGTDDYNDVFEVLSVTADTFNIEHADDGDDAKGTFIMPAHFKINDAIAAGKYVNHALASITPAANSKEFDMAIFVNGTAQQKTYITHKTKDSGDYDTIALNGFIDLSLNDVVWLGVMGKTDGTNITFKHANFNIKSLQ